MTAQVEETRVCRRCCCVQSRCPSRLTLVSVGVALRVGSAVGIRFRATVGNRVGARVALSQTVGMGLGGRVGAAVGRGGGVAGV